MSLSAMRAIDNVIIRKAEDASYRKILEMTMKSESYGCENSNHLRYN